MACLLLATLGRQFLVIPANAGIHSVLGEIPIPAIDEASQSKMAPGLRRDDEQRADATANSGDQGLRADLLDLVAQAAGLLELEVLGVLVHLRLELADLGQRLFG